jgi:hypothetical protein
LRDARGILRTTKTHHYLGTRAILPREKDRLKQDDFDLRAFLNARCLQLTDDAAPSLNVGLALKAVNNFIHRQRSL